jgi:hypothetical protein
LKGGQDIVLALAQNLDAPIWKVSDESGHTHAAGDRLGILTVADTLDNAGHAKRFS